MVLHAEVESNPKYELHELVRSLELSGVFDIRNWTPTFIQYTDLREIWPDIELGPICQSRVLDCKYRDQARSEFGTRRVPGVRIYRRACKLASMA